MSHLEPSFRVNVDVTNPGQFFACCGLLELAHQVDHNALGWFENGCFAVGVGGASLPDLLDYLVSIRPIDGMLLCDICRRNQKNKAEKRIYRLQPHEIAFCGGQVLTLDWWLKPADTADLRLWSGSNSFTGFFRDSTDAIKQDLENRRKDDEPWSLDRSFQMKTQPFFFAASRRLHENEFGVSMDKIESEFQHFPYIELLCAIGLQRFRPFPLNEGRFRYSAWHEPLEALLASVIVCGCMAWPTRTDFAFRVVDRDDNGHRQFLQAERMPT
jgi:CRISPR-associated protein Csx14